MNAISRSCQSITLDRVPSPPGIAARLLEIIDDPDLDIDDVIKIVSADAALSSRLISFCNTPSQSRGRETTTLQQAVTRIGSKRLKLLALSFSLIKQPAPEDGFDFDHFWAKSLANAIVSSALGKTIERNNEEDFLLGLVMNIGQVALATSNPDAYGDEFQRVLAADFDTQLQKEAELFGSNRFEVGAALLSQWRFPDSMCRQIGLLGDMKDVGDSSAKDFFFVATSIAKLLYATGEDEREAVCEFVTQQAHEVLGVDQDKFKVMLHDAETVWGEYASLLGIKNEDASDSEAIELAARTKMLEISLQTEDELQEIQLVNSQLAKDNNIDELTSLLSRRAYRRESGEMLERAKFDNDSLAVLVLDVDHFKSVNDTYGHAVGDCVLKTLGEVISANIRKYDRAYRFGGEEFVVLLLNCTFIQTLQVAERLRQAIAKSPIEVGQSESISVTASVGISWAMPTQDAKIEELFERADKQLYEAKRRGRNQCACDPASPE